MTKIHICVRTNAWPKLKPRLQTFGLYITASDHPLDPDLTNLEIKGSYFGSEAFERGCEYAKIYNSGWEDCRETAIVAMTAAQIAWENR